MDVGIKSFLKAIEEPNQTPAMAFWRDLEEHLADVPGSAHKHQAWQGGYRDHIQEIMNIATMLHHHFTIQRPLPFGLSSVLLVLFLHDCEKPFKYATDEQLAQFPWVKQRPSKSDKTFQKLLIEHYGFTLTEDEWNGLRYVEGELEDYHPTKRIQGPLAAFCHACDTLSARLWYDYPKKEKS